MLAPARQGIPAEGYQVRDSVGSLEGAGRPGRVPEGKAPPVTLGGDRERKLVTVSYSFATGKRERAVERTVTREYARAKLAEKAALYREEERISPSGPGRRAEK